MNRRNNNFLLPSWLMILLSLFSLFLWPAQAAPFAHKQGRQTHPARAQRASSSDPLAELQSRIQAILNQDGLAAASFGVCVMREKDRQIVFEQDAKKLL